MRAALLSMLVMTLGWGCDSRLGEPPAKHRPVSTGATQTAQGSTTPVAPSAAVGTAAPTASAAPADPPLTEAGQLVELEVPGFATAVVAVPAAAKRPWPLVIATHGNYDRPGWQCEVWHRTFAARTFVLCPRGIPRPDSPSADDTRFHYQSNKVLERELDAGIAALSIRYAAHLAEGPVLYTGFSLGAILGVKIAARHPKRFPWLVLVEGGHDAWTSARVKAYADGGGKRVLFACGQKGCQIAAKRAARKLETAGIGTRVELSPGLGHSYGGPISQLVRNNLAWLLEGDDRWDLPPETSPD
ncbi:MAG: alpha/beta hydrolase [Deltaproteobacteria bacterium]|nr:alpha/beta hydrolase [Deltaproteobacteria bacterium]